MTGWWLGATLWCAGAGGVALWRAGRNRQRRHLWRAVRALGLMAALLWLASDPSWPTPVPVPRHTVRLMVLDDSCSMRLPVRAGGPSRYHEGRAVLRAAARLTSDPEPRFVTLSGAALGDGELSAEHCASQSRIIEQLAALAQRQEHPVIGAVLVSDGIDTAGLPPSRQRQAAAALGFAVDARPIGTALPDLRLAAIRHGDFAFVKTDVPIDIDVDSRALSPRNAAVRLYQGAQLMGEQVVRLAPDATTTVSMKIRADTVGPMTLLASVAPQSEEVLHENNTYATSLQILRDKTRVLHVLGAPSVDGRFVREALLASSNVDLVSFYILRTPSTEAVVSEQELSLIPFPVQQLFTTELQNFDAVVLQDFDPRPFGMQPYVGHLAEAVRQGLGLIMVGGPHSFADGGWDDTPLRDVLPVHLDARGARALPPPQTSPVFTASGRWHPLMAGLPEACHGSAGGPLLPVPLQEVGPLQPMAAALIEVPHTGVGALPLLAAREVHEGRTISLASNGSWRWSFSPEGPGQPFVRRLWQNVLTYLSRDGSDARLSLSFDASRLQAGGSAAGVVRLLGEDYRPAAGQPVGLRAQMLAAPMAGPSSALASARPLPEQMVVTDADGAASFSFDAVPAGRLRIEAVARSGAQPSLAHATLAVSPSAEDSGVTPDPAFMNALTQHSGERAAGDTDAATGAGAAAPRTLLVARPLWPRDWLALAVGIALLWHVWRSRQTDLYGASPES